MAFTGQLGTADSRLANIELGGPIPLVSAPLYPTPLFEVNFTDDPIARYRDVVMGAFPVAYWRLGESSGTLAADESGNGRHGTYTNTPTLAQTSNLGDADTAVSFNGSDEYVSVGSYDFFASRLVTAYSITAWVNPSALLSSGASSAADIFAFAYPGSGDIPYVLSYGRYDALGVTDNRFFGAFFVASTGWDVIQDSEPYDDPGRWVHLALTWFQSPDTLVLYRDGQEVARRTPVNNVSAGVAGNGAYIGRRWDGGTYFPGLIDDVAVFDYELSPVQVAKMYAAAPVRSTAQKEDAYVDLTDRIRSFSVRRGRASSVDRVEAGGLNVTLDNRDGALNPDPIINLLDNPSGEQWTWTAAAGYVPDEWTTSGTNAFVSTPDAAAPAGRRKFVITSSSSTEAWASPSDDAGALRNNMVAGGEYTFSASVYVPTAGAVAAANVRLDFITVAPAGTVTTSSSAAAGLDAWERLQVTRTIPADATEAYVRVWFDPTAANQYIYFDAVQLEEAAAASTYCDGDQTDCRWHDEPHQSMSHRKTADGYLNVMTGRNARLSATYAAVDYGIIQGTIDSIRFDYPGVGKDAVVQLQVSDAFKVLSQQNFASFRRPYEIPGDRIRAALRAAAIAESKISVDDTQIISAKLQAITGSAEAGSVDTSSPLEHIRNVEQSERGVFFVDRDGNHVYQGVGHRADVTPSFTLTDTANISQYSDLPITLDDGNIVNDRRITAGAVTQSTVRQVLPASIRRHFVRSVAETQLWVSELSVWSPEASVANPSVDQIPIAPAKDPALMWPAMLEMEISDKIVLERHHDYGSTDVLGGYIQTVEGVQHNWTPSLWTVALGVSPSHTGSPYVQRPTDWDTPITRPRVMTSQKSVVSATSHATAAVAFQEGALYIVQARVISGGAPVVSASSSSAGTWALIRQDAVDVNNDLATLWMIATDTVSQAITLSYGGATATLSEWVVLEVAEGFPASPIGVNDLDAFGSSTTGTFSVGTLDSARSVVVACAWKNANGSATWPDWTETYDLPAISSFTAVYGTPGDSGTSVTWTVGEAWAVQSAEIKAAADLVIG